MNSIGSEELERQLDLYGGVLLNEIETERERLNRSALDPELTPLTEPIGNRFSAGKASSWPARAFAGLGLAAVVVFGFIALSAVSTHDASPTEAADGEPAPTGEEEGSSEESEDPATGTADSDGSAGEAVSVGGPMPVTVDIFSGRPNPTFEMADAEYADLQQAVDALPVAPNEVVAVDEQLGFRGFVIEPYGYGASLYSLRITEEEVVLRLLTSTGDPLPDESGPNPADIVLSDEDQSVYRLLRAVAAKQLDGLVEEIPEPSSP